MWALEIDISWEWSVTVVPGADAPKQTLGTQIFVSECWKP